MLIQSQLNPLNQNSGRAARNVRIGCIFHADELDFTDDTVYARVMKIVQLATREERRRIRLGLRRAPVLPIGTPARLLSLEVAEWEKEQRRRGFAESTITARSHWLRLLRLACGGDINVADIDTQHIDRFFEIVGQWPRRALGRNRFAGLTDEEILAIGQTMPAPRRSASTFNAAKRDLATFFNRLEDTKAIECSPMRGFLDIRVIPVDGEEKRRPFTPQELRSIFDATTYRAWAKDHPHRWWGPLIALFTGMRANEIAQLKVKDVRMVEGVQCLSVRLTRDEDLGGHAMTQTRQSVKGRSSIRDIPIPQPLLDAGFLDYVADVRRAGFTRLFPHMRHGVNRRTGAPNGRNYGSGLASQFGRYLRMVLPGLPRGFGMHLFRNTFASNLSDAGVAVELIGSLTGHKAKQFLPVLQTRYIKPSPGKLLAKQVKALARLTVPVEVPRYEPGQFHRAFRNRRTHV